MSVRQIYRAKSSTGSSFRGFRLENIVFLAGLVIIASWLTDGASAQTYISPHGGYSDYTQFCSLCHDLHEAPGQNLGRYKPESAVCFTCHNGTGSNYNTQLQMNRDPSQNAMHPITVNLPANPGTYNYTPRTTLGIAPPGPYDCSQCHDPHNDLGFNKLLKANYSTDEYVPFTSDAYVSCFQCHDSSQIIADDSENPFREHARHVVQQNSPCTACHFSPHGVSHTELVSFNPAYVSKSLTADSGPTFIDEGENRGTCTLTCHGVDHDRRGY